jgi:hypothetical protein
MWLGTASNGLIQIIGDDKKNFTHDIQEAKSLSSGFIHSLKRDNYGRLWVGARSGLNIFHVGADSFLKVQHDLKNISPYCPRVYCSIATNDGQYWIGSGCGLLLIDQHFNLIHQYNITPHFQESAYDENVLYSLLQDRYDENKLWIGTRYGLKSFNKASETFTTHVNPDKWHDKFPNAQQYAYMDIVQTGPQEIWLAALWSGGILRFNPEKNRWNQYLFPGSSASEPRSGNQMHSLQYVNDTSFIFGNNIAYGYFNPNTGQYRPLNRYEHGHDRGFNNQYVDRFGFVWIASSGGLYKSTKKLPHFRANDPKPPRIQSITANNSNIFRHKDQIRVDIDSNDLEIKIYSPNYPYAYSNNIRWKTALEDDWHLYDGNNSIQLFNLRVGSYKLIYELRQLPEADQWISGRPLVIHVSQSFFRSNWFLLVIFLVALGLGYLIFLQRVNVIRRREQLKSAHERQLAEVKMSALNSQMNPHFLFNTMNSINHFILKNEVDKASHYLTRFSRLIRQILHNSRQSLVSLEDELNAMNLYVEMEQLRFDDGFDYAVHIDPAIDIAQTKIPPMLMQPYLENAIWHGLLHKDDHRKLYLTIEKDVANLSISIKDNGIGRVAAETYKTNYTQQRKSVGMSITKDRIDLANKLYHTEADIEIIDHYENGTSAGTEIVITLPILNGDSSTAYS